RLILPEPDWSSETSPSALSVRRQFSFEPPRSWCAASVLAAPCWPPLRFWAGAPVRGGPSSREPREFVRRFGVSEFRDLQVPHLEEMNFELFLVEPSYSYRSIIPEIVCGFKLYVDSSNNVRG